MSKGFRIGGYGESEPLVFPKNRKVNIINPQRINGEILKGIGIQFQPTHLHTDNEYVWIVYYEETFKLIATLRIEKELDERGWAKVWYAPKGSGGEEGSQIHIDDLTGDRIKRLVTNRVKGKLDTDRDVEQFPPLQQWGKSQITQSIQFIADSYKNKSASIKQNNNDSI